jgi:hypothetical protein
MYKAVFNVQLVLIQFDKKFGSVEISLVHIWMAGESSDEVPTSVTWSVTSANNNSYL